MNEDSTKENEETTLLDFFALLWRRKIMIIVITVVAMVGVVVFSIIAQRLPPEISPLPNRFTASAYILITEDNGGTGEAVLGFRHTRTSTNYSDLAMFLLRSNSLIDSVVDDLVLAEWCNIYGLSIAESRVMLRNALNTRANRDSGVLNISFTHINPVFATDVVNFAIAQLENRFAELGLDRNRVELESLELNITNTFREIIGLESESRRLEQRLASVPLGGADIQAVVSDINRVNLELEAMRQVYIQLRLRQEMLHINIASEASVFQVLELAEVPFVKSNPNRPRLYIIVSVVAGIFSVFLAFIFDRIAYIRKKPEVMAKFRGRNV